MKCKKVLAVLLTAAMTMSLAACGGSQETQNEGSTTGGREGNHSGRSIGSGDGWPGGCRRCSHINLIC